MTKTIVLIVFLTVQVVGLASSWFWAHPYSVAGSLLWGLSLFTLLPGNLLGPWVVQSLLWQSHLKLGTLSAISAALCFGVNAIVWSVVVAICPLICGHRTEAGASWTTSRPLAEKRKMRRDAT